MSDSTQQVSEWLSKFGSALDRVDFDAAVKMFEEDSYWRDLVSLTWNIITLEGKEKIKAMLEATAPIHESRLRLGCLLKARRSAGRWWSSDKADWKSVVVTWSGRRLYPLHWMKR